MLNEAQIKDRGWESDLNNKFGWMGGGYLSFECSGGWRFLLGDLLRRIDLALEGEERESFQVSQIKEKFGTLRFYHNGGERIERLVETAEKLSETTCDVCGSGGRLQGKGWVSVRCQAHEDWRG